LPAVLGYPNKGKTMIKSLIAALILISTTSTFAVQSIVCREVTKAGKLRANGGTVKLNLEYNQDGSLSRNKNSIKVNGFTRGDSDLLSDLTVNSINESDKTTTFFIYDQEGMLDIQLHLNAPVANKSFRSERANFGIGSEDANPENYFGFGFDVICNGYLK
jgi:hypothetical protein